MTEYNERDAIRLMRAALTPERADKISSDEILNIIDMIWDYYETHGCLDIDLDDEADDDPTAALDRDDLIKYVKQQVAKDRRSPVLPDEVEPLVLAELAYEETVDTENEI